MTDEPLTAGEIAANLLGAGDIRTCVCAWVDSKGSVVWYKMGSSMEAIGICSVLIDAFKCEVEEDEE